MPLATVAHAKLGPFHKPRNHPVRLPLEVARFEECRACLMALWEALSYIAMQKPDHNENKGIKG